MCVFIRWLGFFSSLSLSSSFLLSFAQLKCIPQIKERRLRPPQQDTHPHSTQAHTIHLMVFNASTCLVCINLIQSHDTFFLASRLSTWYEDLEEYEGNLEEMATATLDQVRVESSHQQPTRMPRISQTGIDVSR